MALDRIVLETRVEEWGQKCAAYVKEHGKENPHYLLEYGRALFAVAKLNSSLIDSQKMEEKQLPMENPRVKVVNFEEFEDAPQDQEDQEDDQKETDPSRETAERAATEQSNEAPKGSPLGERQADGETKEKSQPAADGAGDGPTADTATGETQVGVSSSPSTESADVDAGEQEDDGAEQDEDDFEVAFQIVDLARVLFEKEPKSKENDAVLAAARELLGDISLEDDNAAQAVEDYTAAVELKRELYGSDAGEVSEVEYMLSLAHDAAGNSRQSLDHLKLAAAAAEAAKLPSAAELAQRAKDLEQDLKAAAELQGKDTEQAKAAMQESISGRAAIATAVQSLVSSANDISNLARKRKRDDPKPPAKREAP